MITTRTRNLVCRMDFHRGGSVTGATANKLSEKPHFHKLYSKGLITVETAPKMGTRNREDKHELNTNDDYYVTYKEAENRSLRRCLAKATKVNKKIAHKPEITTDLYLLTQANEAKKAGLGIAIYDKKDNLVLKTHEGQLHDPHGKNQESCVICFDDYIDFDLMFSVDRCGHRFCVNCVKQHIAVKLLDGALPNCLQHGCTSQLSVDRCGKLLTPAMSLKWKERTKEDSIPSKDKVYCPYKSCSYLMSRTELVLVSGGGQINCLKCGGSFCFYCKAPWHNKLLCIDYKKSQSDIIQNGNLIFLANRKGWRQCGKCNHMVERSGGCRFMTCRCGYYFCYDCGAGLNSSVVHRCRIPQPRITSDALRVLGVSLCLVLMYLFGFVMYTILG